MIGIEQSNKKVYVCEVAVHLATGLQYTKDGKPNVQNKILDKFKRDIDYVTQMFPNYKIFPMFWSPIVKNTTSNPAETGLIAVKNELSILYPNVAPMELIINEEWSSKVDELRKVAKGKSNELFGVMRVFQIEEWLNDYLSKHPKIIPALAPKP